MIYVITFILIYIVLWFGVIMNVIDEYWAKKLYPLLVMVILLMLSSLMVLGFGWLLDHTLDTLIHPVIRFTPIPM